MNLNKLLMKFCMNVSWITFKIWYFVKSLNLQIYLAKQRTKKLPKEGKGEDLYIVLNGPSLKTQDLSKLMGKNIMFVNRGFLHPLYKELKPKYHVFVDSKLRDGIWPIEWIEEIFRINPGVRIILPVEWYNNERFTRYRHDSRIFWQYWRVPFYLLGVSGACFSYGISQKFSNIFFTGFDANGCAYDMIKSSESHFYGGDPELQNMTTMQHSYAMFSTALHFIELNNLANYCIKKGINIYNLTNGGLLDMFPRKSLCDL